VPDFANSCAVMLAALMVDYSTIDDEEWVSLGDAARNVLAGISAAADATRGSETSAAASSGGGTTELETETGERDGIDAGDRRRVAGVADPDDRDCAAREVRDAMTISEQCLQSTSRPNVVNGASDLGHVSQALMHRTPDSRRGECGQPDTGVRCA
jgi:hypothetical protein